MAAGATTVPKAGQEQAASFIKTFARNESLPPLLPHHGAGMQHEMRGPGLPRDCHLHVAAPDHEQEAPLASESDVAPPPGSSLRSLPPLRGGYRSLSYQEQLLCSIFQSCGARPGGFDLRFFFLFFFSRDSFNFLTFSI